MLPGVTLQAFDLYKTIRLVGSSFAPHTSTTGKEGQVLFVDLNVLQENVDYRFVIIVFVINDC